MAIGYFVHDRAVALSWSSRMNCTPNFVSRWLDDERAPFIGAKRGDDIRGKIKSLVGEETNAASKTKPRSKDVIDRLYSILSVLDAKANGLLRVNSFFLTIVVFFIGWANSSGFPPRLAVFKPIAYIDTVLLLLSSLFCMWIVRVTWKFLGYVKDDNNFDPEIENLCKVVDDRTHFYWLAWWATLATLVISVVWSLIILISRWAKHFLT